jgi:hypothetical protein
MMDRPAAIPLATIEVTLRDAWALLNGVYTLQESAFGNHDRSTPRSALETERQVLAMATLSDLMRRMWLASLAQPRASRSAPDHGIDAGKGGETEDKGPEK